MRIESELLRNARVANATRQAWELSIDGQKLRNEIRERFYLRVETSVNRNTQVAKDGKLM